MISEQISIEGVARSASGGATVIAVVGLCGTGKSEAVGYLERNLSAPVVYFGGVVLSEVQRRGLEVSAANERIVRESIRATGGMSAIAGLAAADIESALRNSPRLVIDGLYSFAEYELLKAKYGRGLVLLAIHSARHLRYARMAIRKVRPLSAREVDDRDLTEIKNLDKGGPIAIADFHIINDGTVEALHAQLADVVRQIEQRAQETTA